jgi:hypothetical protein
MTVHGDDPLWVGRSRGSRRMLGDPIRGRQRRAADPVVLSRTSHRYRAIAQPPAPRARLAHMPSLRRPLFAPLAVTLATLVTLAGCSAPGGDARSEAASPARSARPLATVAPSETVPVTGEVPADLLGGILADAIDRTGVPESEIEIARAEEMTWPDGALGCPEPGQVYTQALVDGFQVVVEAAGERLDYRATANGSFRLCEGGGRPAG